jgi:tight adherence protein C
MASPLLWLLIAAGLMPVGIFGLRGWLDIHDALSRAEFDRLASPVHWPLARGLMGALAGLPVLIRLSPMGISSLWVAGVIAALAYASAPRLLRALRRRAEHRVCDDLPLHLDLIAVAMETGSSWAAALALCVERAPEGPLRRAWERVGLEIHAGVEPIEALRALDQRMNLRPITTVVSALRAAEKLQLPWAPVLRERARQNAANRFARAEHRARAAPLKLWAAMWLCLAPCTAVVLAYPVARWLAWVAS